MFRLLLRPQNVSIGLENGNRAICTTSVCFKEPPKKKVIMDPIRAKKQYERKVRRLEREIKSLKSAKPKLKPILELQLPIHVKQELNSRIRQEKDEVGRKLLDSYSKIWSIYASLEASAELYHIRNCVKAQEKALNVLKRDYPELYNEAVQLDEGLIPYRIFNSKKETPPIENFSVSDGKQEDITKQWKL